MPATLGFTLIIHREDTGVDVQIQAVYVAKFLVREVVAFQVPPVALDGIQLRRIAG